MDRSEHVQTIGNFLVRRGSEQAESLLERPNCLVGSPGFFEHYPEGVLAARNPVRLSSRFEEPPGSRQTLLSINESACHPARFAECESCLCGFRLPSQREVPVAQLEERLSRLGPSARCVMHRTER